MYCTMRVVDVCIPVSDDSQAQQGPSQTVRLPSSAVDCTDDLHIEAPLVGIVDFVSYTAHLLLFVGLAQHHL